MHAASKIKWRVSVGLILNVTIGSHIPQPGPDKQIRSRCPEPCPCSPSSDTNRTILVRLSSMHQKLYDEFQLDTQIRHISYNVSTASLCWRPCVFLFDLQVTTRCEMWSWSPKSCEVHNVTYMDMNIKNMSGIRCPVIMRVHEVTCNAAGKTLSSASEPNSIRSPWPWQFDTCQ
jgi:hypothetical protein